MIADISPQRSEIEKRMEAKVSVEFEYVEDIPRGEGGELKAMVVEVEHGREDRWRSGCTEGASSWPFLPGIWGFFQGPVEGVF